MTRRRIRKFNALVGMIAVSTMFILYFLAVPTFKLTTSGAIFSVVWLIVALAAFGGFAIKIFKRVQKRRAVPARNMQGTPARLLTHKPQSQPQHRVKYY